MNINKVKINNELIFRCKPDFFMCRLEDLNNISLDTAPTQQWVGLKSQIPDGICKVQVSSSHIYTHVCWTSFLPVFWCDDVLCLRHVRKIHVSVLTIYWVISLVSTTLILTFFILHFTFAMVLKWVILLSILSIFNPTKHDKNIYLKLWLKSLLYPQICLISPIAFRIMSHLLRTIFNTCHGLVQAAFISPPTSHISAGT